MSLISPLGQSSSSSSFSSGSGAGSGSEDKGLGEVEALRFRSWYSQHNLTSLKTGTDYSIICGNILFNYNSLLCFCQYLGYCKIHTNAETVSPKKLQKPFQDMEPFLANAAPARTGTQSVCLLINKSNGKNDKNSKNNSKKSKNSNNDKEDKNRIKR